MAGTNSIGRELDSHIVTLLSKISAMRESHQQQERAQHRHEHNHQPPVSVEAWSLELWRAVAVECFATFLFAFIVAGAAIASAVSGSGLNVLATAIASGFAIAAVQLIFGPVSGGHVNPAVSISFALSRKVSALRAALYIAAQCGGGIAGAAMLYGVANTPQNLMATPGRLSEQAPLKLLVELSLSIFVILAHYAAESPRALPSTISAKPACVLAAAYTAATLVSSPFLNPARALGPAFVMNKWDNHWVYWMGPIAGGAIAALLHEYVLSNHRRSRDHRDYDDDDNSSMRSNDETYDDLEKSRVHKFAGGYATYRPVAGAASIYAPAPVTHGLERVESIYGGTKSLYCKSPQLTRANLNRSQSVYAKSTSAGLRDHTLLPKPGPLVPAQSLYPIRLNAMGHEAPSHLQQQHQLETRQQNLLHAVANQPTPGQNHNSTNQNMQNQMQQQCTQSIYGIRGITGTTGQRDNIYGHLAVGNRESPTSIYSRAPAPPPSSHVIPVQQVPHQHQHQHQHQQQQQPTRDNGHASPHQSSQDGSSSAGGSMRRNGQPTEQHQQSQQQQQQQQQQRPESMYGHAQRTRAGDDSAYGSYGSSRGGVGNGIYGKTTGPPPPPHGYQVPRPLVQQQQVQQQQQSSPAQQPGYQRHSPNPPPPQY